jgi:hypothetical protein
LADYQTYIRSIRTTDSIRGNAEFGTGGALRFIIGANQSRTTNSEAIQEGHEIKLRWNLDGQTSLDGAIARIKRSHDHYEERDFTSTNARFNLTWLPDVPWRLGAYARRDYNTWWNLTASYTVTDTIGVTPNWQVTDKISLYGKAEHAERKFRAPLIATTESRTDKTSLYSLSLQWQFIHNLTMGGSIDNSRRSSNTAGYDFTDTTASINPRPTF